MTSTLVLLMLLIGLVSCSPDQSNRRDALESTAARNVQVLEDALVFEHSGEAKTLRLYLPPSYAHSEQRYPVLYMHDGQNLFDVQTAYAEEWQVDEVLNRLAADNQLEVIVVGIDHAGERRVNELSPWHHAEHGEGWGDHYVDFIVHTLKPWVDGRYRTRPEAEHTAILGSSLGGLNTQYAIHRYPNVFSKAGVFSPSLWYAPDAFAYAKQHPLTEHHKIYYLAGSEEGGHIPRDTKRLAEQQRQTDVVTQIKIEEGGEHNEALWREHLSSAIQWLFDSEKT